MTRRALFLRHDPGSLPGLIGEALSGCGFDLDVLAMGASIHDGTFTGELPDPGDYDLVLPMGAIWSINDDSQVGTWIDRELKLLRDADHQGVPVWGVCFGAQALAAAHGGQVVRSGTPEIGYTTVETLDPRRLPAGPWMQWHYDVFTVPDDAQLLATTDVGPQAFTLRTNLATQFHPEVDLAMVDNWIGLDPAGAAAAVAEVDTTLEQIRADAVEQRDRAVADITAILDWWLPSVGLD